MNNMTVKPTKFGEGRGPMMVGGMGGMGGMGQMHGMMGMGGKRPF